MTARLPPYWPRCAGDAAPRVEQVVCPARAVLAPAEDWPTDDELIRRSRLRPVVLGARARLDDAAQGAWMDQVHDVAQADACVAALVHECARAGRARKDPRHVPILQGARGGAHGYIARWGTRATRAPGAHGARAAASPAPLLLIAATCCSSRTVLSAGGTGLSGGDRLAAGPQPRSDKGGRVLSCVASRGRGRQQLRRRWDSCTWPL